MQSENFKIEKLKMRIDVNSQILPKKELIIDLRRTDITSIKMAENNLKRRAKLFDEKLFKNKLVI